MRISAWSSDVCSSDLKVERLLRQTYGKLSAWQKTQVARHPDMPHFQHYISALIDDFTPLEGDPLFAEDEAIVGGLGRNSDERGVGRECVSTCSSLRSLCNYNKHDKLF